MKNKEILPVAKITFWLSFGLGNVFLFGYLLTKDEGFALAGYFLLIFGTILNLLVFAGLIIFGIYKPEMRHIAERSALLLLINIPVAIIYAFIGINIIF